MVPGAKRRRCSIGLVESARGFDAVRDVPTLQFFDKSWQDRYFLDRLCDGLHDLIVPLNNRQDLFLDILQLSRPCLRLTRTNVGILHLSRRGICLKLIGFSSLVLTAKEATGDLVQEILQHARIALLATLHSPFKFLNF